MAKIKILVVSSDSELVGFLKKELDENSYQLIFTQYTREELRDVVHQELPGLVIVDVMMPSLDGIEISLRIRQWSPVPIIMLSAWEAGRNSVRCFDLSAESYLSEPLGAYEVIALVERALWSNSTDPVISLSQDIHPVISPDHHYIDMGEKVKIECAWCGKYMGEKDGYGVEGVTHGMCKQCSAKLKVEAKNRVASVKSNI